MEYSSIAIANYLLDLAWKNQRSIDPLKLQKLVFVGQGWHLAAHGRRIVGENVEAWDFGPVFPQLYHEFKKYRRSPIARPGLCFDKFDPDQETDEGFVLDQLWRVHKDVTGISMANKTHEPGSPWEQVIRKYVEEKEPIPSYLAIPDDIIRDYYSKELRRNVA